MPILVSLICLGPSFQKITHHFMLHGSLWPTNLEKKSEALKYCHYHVKQLLISSDSLTLLDSWALGLAVCHINEPNCKLMSPEHFFIDNSAILLHPGTR